MIDYRNPPHALLIITSPYYNEKLNEFLLTCDWESLNKKWNKLGDENRYWGRHQKTVEFIFFEEQSDWREKYQPFIDSGEITAELLEENRPFNVLRDYAHNALKLDEVDEPMFIFLPAQPQNKMHLEEVMGRTSIELYASEDILTQMEYFLEMKLNQYYHYRPQGRYFEEQYDFLRGQEILIDYRQLSLRAIKDDIRNLRERLSRTNDIQEQMIIQIKINIFNDMFLNDKLSVGNPDIELTSEDEILLEAHHYKIIISFDRAKDKALYFYFLMRAKLGEEFISFEDMMEQDLEKLEGIYKVMRDGKKKETVFNIRDLQDFRETKSRINRRIEEKVAKHLTDGYAITAQDQKPKLYGIQAEPDRIKIHKNSSLYWYMKSRVNVI